MKFTVPAGISDQAPTWPPARSEAAAWAGILGFAVLVRVSGLGDPPLTPDEGQRALEAWRLWHEGSVDYAGGPLLPNLLSLVFGLFTAAEGQARLVAAVAGSALVLVPAVLRHSIGPRAAQSMAVVLAASPPLVLASRTVSPAVLVSGLVLVSLACGWMFVERRGTVWLAAGLSGVFLGLAADPSFTVALSGLLLAVAIAEGESIIRPELWRPVRTQGARALAIALLVAWCADTRLMLNPAGLQAGLIDPLWRWIGDVARGSGLVTPILLLLVDGGTLTLAAVGLTQYRRHPRLVRFLGIWLLVSVAVASLMRQPDLRYLLLPFMPAALLGGLGLRRLVDLLREHGSLSTALFGLMMLVPLVAAAFRINVGLRSGQDPWVTAILLASAGLLLIVVIMVRTLAWVQAAAALATFASICILLATVATTSRLLDARGSSRSHLLDVAVVTDAIRDVQAEVLAWEREDPARPIPVDPSLGPLVAWALRDVEGVEYDPAAERREGRRLLANVPPSIAPAARARRVIVGYVADRTTMDLRPARIWAWLVSRQNLVDVRPRAILVVRSAGS